MVQKVDFIRVIRNSNIEFYGDYDENGNEITMPENFFRSTVEVHANDDVIAVFTNVEQIDIEHTFNGSIVFDNTPNAYIIKCYKEMKITGHDWGIVEIRDTNKTVEEADFDNKMASLRKITGGM